MISNRINMLKRCALGWIMRSFELFFCAFAASLNDGTYMTDIAWIMHWLCDVWCVMCDVWCVMCDVWCVMCDVWCVMCDVWCVMCDVWCVMCDVWCVMCDVWWVMCDVWCAMCDAWRHWYEVFWNGSAAENERNAHLFRSSIYRGPLHRILRRRVARIVHHQACLTIDSSAVVLWHVNLWTVHSKKKPNTFAQGLLRQQLSCHCSQHHSSCLLLNINKR